MSNLYSLAAFLCKELFLYLCRGAISVAVRRLFFYSGLMYRVFAPDWNDKRPFAETSLYKAKQGICSRFLFFLEHRSLIEKVAFFGLLLKQAIKLGLFWCVSRLDALFWCFRRLVMSVSEPQLANKLIFTVRLFPEITIKSPSMRKRWTKHLVENIRILGRKIHPKTSVIQDWDRIEVRVAENTEAMKTRFVDMLGHTPGISNYSTVKSFPFESIDDVYQKAYASWSEALVGKTFCVRVKRSGQHDFTSTEVERYVGGGLNQNINTGGVRLKSPEVTVNIEIKDGMFFIVDEKYPGIGGFPVGTQEPVLSLVSGGFDSTVASYMMIKRGLRTNYCFFNLGGRAHEVGVKEIAYYLWNRFGATHRVRFVTVPFEGVVQEIMEKVDPANMGVVLKRMMLRAADVMANKGGIQAIVTGEAVAQVSSQTIPNLSLIDSVTDKLVLRPLIVADKTDIIRTAREIGAEEFSANIPEYCGVISVKPSARVNKDRMLEEEALIDPAVLEKAIADCEVQTIDKVMVKEGEEQVSVDTVSTIPKGGVVVDVRHPDEAELRPLKVEGTEVVNIPFFRLSAEFATLDGNLHYYFYCERGVMSELHAFHMKDDGHQNVSVFRPESAR